MDDAFNTEEVTTLLEKSTVGEVDIHKALRRVLALMNR
jgi:hypothetical protein